MSVGPGMTVPHVRIRLAARDWIRPLLLAGFWLVLAAGARFWLVIATILVVEALWVRKFGIDLTPEAAMVRGIRRRSVPWSQVQAVVQTQLLSTWRVRLILERGDSERLRAPTTVWGFGRAAYERDFHRIGQCWLANRGPDWRPLRPEAPRL